VRKTRYDVRQRYGCNACGCTFTAGVTKHSSYPVKLIMEGISCYNLGYSARKTISYLRHRFNLPVPEKTFRRWYAAHKPLCTYHTIRARIQQHYSPRELVEKRPLQHRQVYLYQLHHGKLDLLFSLPRHRAYQSLKDYLFTVPRPDFPHHFFTTDTSDRSSNYPTLLSTRVTRRESYATELAALALQVATSNKKRHDAIERFMLLNDSATIAVEVPIYLTPEDFAIFRAQGFTFPFGNKPITGHIDLLQVRSGYVRILDYKPNAKAEKHMVTQLTIYALALSRRTGIPVKSFSCAWFDKNNYFEFFPLPAVYPKQQH
jgi:hypothetical protein